MTQEKNKETKEELSTSTFMNKWWFKFAVFGLASALLLLVSSWFSGFAAGLGIMSFWVKFKGSGEKSA